MPTGGGGGGGGGGVPHSHLSPCPSLPAPPSGNYPLLCYFFIIIMASAVNSRRRLRRSSSACSAAGHPHPYRLQPTVQPLFLSHSRSAASLRVCGSPRDDQEYCDVLYKLDLGVESPYLGTAYADEAFGKRVVEEEEQQQQLPRAVLGHGKANEEDVGRKVDDCRMWYVVIFFNFYMCGMTETANTQFKQGD